MDRLPADIIHIIVVYATAERGESLWGWRRALRLLNLNRTWRAIALHIVYDSVVINLFRKGPGDAPKLYATTGTGQAPHFVPQSSSNLSLVEGNGYASLVKRFYLHDKAKWHSARNLLHILDTFEITTTNCPSIARITAWAYAHDIQYRGTDGITEDITAATKDAAANLACRLPNITRFSVDSNFLHFLLQKFLYALAHEYLGKMTHLHTAMPCDFYVPFSSESLTSFSTEVRAERKQHLLSVDPRSLKTVQLLFMAPGVSWRSFMAATDLNTISFDNLQYLDLVQHDYKKGEVLYGFRDANEIAQTTCLPSFPKMTKLRMLGVTHTPEDAELLLQPHLKELIYRGDPGTAHILCMPQLNCLSVLKLRFDFKLGNSSDERFAEQVNAVLRHASGIPTVHFVTRMSNGYHRFHAFHKIYWPHVTHLYIGGSVNPFYLLCYAANMPDLVELTFDCTNGCNIANHFQLLRKVHSEAIASKIERIFLTADQRTANRFDYSVDLVQELSWYLPNLKYAGITAYNPSFS